MRVRGDAFDLVKHSISVPSDLLAETFHFSESKNVSLLLGHFCPGAAVALLLEVAEGWHARFLSSGPAFPAPRLRRSSRRAGGGRGAQGPGPAPPPPALPGPVPGRARRLSHSGVRLRGRGARGLALSHPVSWSLLNGASAGCTQFSRVAFSSSAADQGCWGLGPCRARTGCNPSGWATLPPRASARTRCWRPSLKQPHLGFCVYPQSHRE